jgi:formate/nitrite transporter FocA (FNT family)
MNQARKKPSERKHDDDTPKSEHEREAERVEEQVTPPTPVIYETVRRLGEEEMERPATSLWWSGLAAGLSISFSLLAQALLRQHLPDTPWRELVAALGYPVGFLIVVLGRQQLFTETTITVVLPVMAEPRRFAGAAARMWAIVLVANLAGTLLSALFISFTPVITADLRESMLEISQHGLAHDALQMGLRGITAGYLMAVMVWLLPAAGQAQFHVVAAVTWLIGAGGFTHIITGSVEGFLLLCAGRLELVQLLGQFMAPTLLGNIVGGTALFAVLSHAQVMKEIDGS